tara:strand:+ start:51 stop:611 length:561 start_codon:yes stop_codon:yes gene_type:complete
MSSPIEYWRWENEVDPKLCKAMIELAEDNWSTAETDTEKQNADIRRGKTFFTSQSYIYDLFFPYMRNANKSADWNFDITSAEACQISKYDYNDRYDFHMDSIGTWPTRHDCPDNEYLHNKTRKISMTCTLNSDFEGGELEFVNGYSLGATQGTIIFFPSFMQHRITPITKGTRYSIVLWFLGAPWR